MKMENEKWILNKCNDCEPSEIKLFSIIRVRCLSAIFASSVIRILYIGDTTFCVYFTVILPSVPSHVAISLLVPRM